MDGIENARTNGKIRRSAVLKRELRLYHTNNEHLTT